MEHRIFKMKFAELYPLYVQKAEKKGRRQEEVDEVICWLTGYDAKGLERQRETGADLETFFEEAPQLNPKMEEVRGVICGVRVENIEDPLMRKIRCLDKLIDELAKGKTMEKIQRRG